MGNDFKNRAAGTGPRELIEKAGTARNASVTDLLAIILKTGAAGCDVVELASRLLVAFGGLNQLVRADFAEFKSRVKAYNETHPEKRIVGLGRVKMLELTAAFELAKRGRSNKTQKPIVVKDAKSAVRAFRIGCDIRADQEAFWVLPLDSRHKPLAEPQLAAFGTANGVSVHTRDVYKIAIRWNAQSIVVAHNHPNGSVEPSTKDIALTESLRASGRLLGIPLLDHLILTEKSHYSFAESVQSGRQN